MKARRALQAKMALKFCVEIGVCLPHNYRHGWSVLHSSEGLQFFAINRHPGLGDVAIDMAGLVTGLLLAGHQQGHQGA